MDFFAEDRSHKNPAASGQTLGSHVGNHGLWMLVDFLWV